MHLHPKALRPWLIEAILLLVWGVALWLRWRQLPVALALGDAMGPYWSAARPDLLPPPHAAIYGGALAWPHRIMLHCSNTLWQAFAGLFAVQALVAPVGALLAWRLSGRLLPMGVVGLILALDPGLLDSTVSGAEGYLGPLAIGLLAVVVARPGPAAGLLGPLAFGVAVANHPLCLCAAPLLLGLPRSRQTALGLVGVGLLLLPQLSRILAAGGGLGQVPPSAPLAAFSAAWELGGAGALLAPIGLLVGLVGARTRKLAALTGLSLILLVCVGLGLGYLRDHHLRLLLIPAVAGLAALPGPWALLPLLLLRPPAPAPDSPSALRRPGTLGLETRLAEALVAEAPGLVEGAWISGGPAAEPGALILDLKLRGQKDFGPDAGLALLVSGEREDLARLPPGLRLLQRGDRHRLLVGTAAELQAWTAALCASPDLPAPRLGGSWDGLVLVRPELGAGASAAWLGCDADGQTTIGAERAAPPR